MPKCLYAIYETNTEKELCLGVFDSIEELSRTWKITPKAAWCNLYRAKKRSAYRKCRYVIQRIDLERKATNLPCEGKNGEEK